ncbi:MAG: glycoside hydrolase family 172 protein [Planctomycetota bacterium]
MFKAQIHVGFLFLITGILISTTAAGEASGPIDFGRLLDEMHDLAGLARWPEAEYTTIQYSSYDRRSVSPEADAWYSNTDGFGGETIPGFLAVLEEPDKDGIGLYLVADVKGPGAVVRSWSAAMDGELKAYLNGNHMPFFEGTGYEFMARKSVTLLKDSDAIAEFGDAFCQQDADYMPIPFSDSFYVTWRGNLRNLHFYHLEVRRYTQGTQVTSFDPQNDPVLHGKTLKMAVERLNAPGLCSAGKRYDEAADLAPDKTWEWDTPSKDQAGAIIGFSLKLIAADTREAWRCTLLRIAFDGSQKPQVESPAGDFFGSGVGLNPFNSFPMEVTEAGEMTCRFVMPYRERARITLYNSTAESMKFKMSVTLLPWEWDERSMYFRAKWRTVNDIDMRFGPFDLPYLVACGKGRFVGVACMLANPSPFPHPYGSWWGEGDEKIFVDNEPFPSFFGTGSEDYYNYSWSRPDLFDHPYCGQPLDSGPGNTGYCSNHRWHILDNLLFGTRFAFYMEMWPHSGRPGLGYSSIAYLYAKPGTLDDHRRIQVSELFVPQIPSMQPEAGFGSHGAVFHIFEQLEMSVSGGSLGFDDTQVSASQGRLVRWTAAPGDRLSVTIPINEKKDYSLNLVAAHWPESGAVRVLIDDTPLVVSDLGGAMTGERESESLVLKSRFARRLLNTTFQPLPMTQGEHTLTLECLEAGRFGLDYLWIR